MESKMRRRVAARRTWRMVWLVVAWLVFSSCTGNNVRDGLAVASETSGPLPCGADLALLGTEPVAVLGDHGDQDLIAHVFAVEDDIGGLDIQKFFFAHCGGPGVIEEPQALRGDIAWQERTETGSTRFGTVAKQPSRVVVVTMELDCLNDACPDADPIYQILSAFGYTIAASP